MEHSLSRKRGQVRKQPRKQKKKQKLTKKSKIIITIVASIIFTSFFYRSVFVDPVNWRSTELVGGFKFEHQEAIRDIAKQLQDKGVITSAFAFQIIAKLRGVDYVGRAGNYAFTQAMTFDEILTILANGETAYDFQIPIGDGGNIDKMLSQFTGGDEAEIEVLNNMINEPAYIRELRVRYPFLPEEILGDDFRHRLEGFLAPGMYYLKDGETIKTLVERALDRFQENYISHHWESKLARVNKTLFEVMTLSSVVRAETFPGDRANQKQVAGVFYNRLEDGMPLGSDPTVGYSINAPDINYTKAELEFDSPYNTYVYKGLPRGPINNPDPDVVDSVIDYNKNDYYFFIADICDDGIGEFGKVYYAKTESEHEGYISKYLGCYRNV